MIQMKIIMMVLLLGVLKIDRVQGAERMTAPAAKKSYNVNIYEKEKASTLSAKVKATKTSRDDTLVYFEDLKKSGPYVLSGTMKDYTKLKNRLIKSAGPQGAKVTVGIDEQDNILSVEIGDTEEPTDGT